MEYVYSKALVDTTRLVDEINAVVEPNLSHLRYDPASSESNLIVVFDVDPDASEKTAMDGAVANH